MPLHIQTHNGYDYMLAQDLHGASQLRFQHGWNSTPIEELVSTDLLLEEEELDFVRDAASERLWRWYIPLNTQAAITGLSELKKNILNSHQRTFPLQRMETITENHNCS